MVALGIIPVGAPEYEVKENYYLQNYQDKIKLMGGEQFNYEAILEMKPDFSLMSESNDGYDELAKIAPAAAFPWIGHDLDDQFRTIANIVGKSDEAEAWINHSRFAWRSFLHALSFKVVLHFESLTSSSRVRTFIMDDSVLRRDRSKKAELIARVHDHRNIERPPSAADFFDLLPSNFHGAIDFQFVFEFIRSLISLGPLLYLCCL